MADTHQSESVQRLMITLTNDSLLCSYDGFFFYKSKTFSLISSASYSVLPSLIYQVPNLSGEISLRACIGVRS